MPDFTFPTLVGLYLIGVLSAGVLTAVFLWTWRHFPLVKRYTELARKVPALDQKHKSLEQRILDAEEVVREAKRKRKVLDSVEAELRKLEPKRLEYEDIKEKLKGQLQQSAALVKELDEKKETIDRLRADRASLTKETEAASRDLGQLRAEMEGQRERTRRLEAEEGRLNVRAAALKEEVERADQRLSRLRTEAVTEKDRVDRLQAERAQLEVAVSAARQQEKDAVARMSALTEQLRVFEETYQRTMKELGSQWDASIGEWRRAQDLTLEQVERHWQELKEHVERAVDIINGTWSRMTPPDAADTAQKYRDLWEPVIRRESLDDSRGQRSEADALADTAAYLKALGLVYPQRVLRAFHTCLKVNEMSPITVLAGISGTGKSLLPRRYAEGMGIHFLGVAVQPRWDSPQDLFGFYNYVESRYKGTELARLLIQAERHNRTDFPWEVDEPLDDRLTLVLLDEMNLARVEYYFSEFLSRLETRRGVDPRDPDQRRSAEIVFEMGALGEGETQVRVFPAGNVLFTGTMNEDETTQTLSDKVLDRANVLRFGKPARLAVQEQIVGQQPVSSAEALSFDTWRSWYREPQRHLSGSDRSTVHEWIHRLNDTMGALGRPFGHRVALAIEQYVANYPAMGDEAVRAAFADQLEQRTMPRLRGLDPTDHSVSSAFDSMERLLEETRDEVLLEAFSRSRSGDLFLWAGVDRAGDGRG